MECQRCCLQPVIHAFTQANIENSLGRMKTKQIIAAVENLKTKFKAVCDTCHALPSQTNSLIEELKSLFTEKFSAVEQSVEKDVEDMRPVMQELQTAFQAVCLTCSRVSNDDNPSNHGQTFVSLDSGNCQADSGKAKTTHTDDNIVQSRADWIGLHKSPDVYASPYDMSPADHLQAKEEGVTEDMGGCVSLLPPQIEDVLRREFSNFVELPIMDKLLLSCLMSGMNVAEFSKMLWFPYSIVDPKTRRIKSITKQAAHARWINIIKRFPVFMSVAISTTKDSQKAKERLVKFLQDPNGEKEDNRFRNGKLSPYFAKAAERAKEIEAQRLENERIAKEKERKAKEKEVRRKKMLNKKKAETMFPEESDVLPGLEEFC